MLGICDITRGGDFWVSYATLMGLDLEAYNTQALSPPCYSSAHVIGAAQLVIHESVLEINRRLIELNKTADIPTTWTAGHVHAYFGHTHHHYYRRLVDGCHPSPRAVGYWATQIAKTIRQT